MNKDLKINGTHVTDFITVGDRINDNTVTEIWCTSFGTAMFCLDNDHDKYYNFDELLLMATPKPPFDIDYEIEECYAEYYKNVTSGY